MFPPGVLVPTRIPPDPQDRCRWACADREEGCRLSGGPGGRPLSWGPAGNAPGKTSCMTVSAWTDRPCKCCRRRGGDSRPGCSGLGERKCTPAASASAARASSAGRGPAGRGGPGRAAGEGRGRRALPGAVNFSWAAACQPQKALKVQQPAPASAAAFVRVIYDFNLGSPRVHTAFAAVEG